ncbi:ferritin-like domain-containing protein [Helicobacter sp. MIT 21-1697]|uniref:ferritin-like domain-containing protein n=1 Tax=Helicobacter sp. MIT 21-1697 TaxID=2993733 RepID=UPI00224B8370|nr:ferritin-like domain-containing protein [Helicobacter sp. MIT 21-1697]MCX2717522.1 ferritin-like domain-containing protein [Helicobacter sp. MIT 21-1697]
MQDSKSCIFMGCLPVGTLFFMRLENALLLTQQGTLIEVVSDRDNLENDISMWCAFKGEEFIQKRIISQNTDSKGNFVYILRKKSPTRFQKFDSAAHIAPPTQGLAPNGVQVELASPNYHFGIESHTDILSSNVAHIYEDSKKAQWNATTDIQWEEIPQFSPALQFAIAQIMTYLTENEFSALYIPARFLGQISPFFTPIPLLLSSIIGDESRHIESFIKRANITGLGVQYSTLTTQQSLFSLWNEKDYFKSSFLLHIMGEGTFIDLLKFLEESFRALGDEASAHLFALARKDESRHVAYGMSNVKQAIAQNPAKITALKEVVFKRKNYLDAQSSESSLLLESMAILRGGGESSAEISLGFEEVLELKKKMEKNRTKRLVECGIDEELALDLSRAHTPNFM